jgi:dTMP kinase
VLDVDPAAGMARFHRRDRIEAEDLEFHRAVREMFLRLAEGQDHYLVLDGALPVDDLAAEIRQRVEPLLGQAKRA